VWHGWPPVLARRWPGRWLAPDLPGHGGSPPLSGYSFASLAAAVAPLVDAETSGDDGDGVMVLGHSLGGVLGLLLAGDRCAVPVRSVVGLGIKVTWTADELARARSLAQRPVTWFATRREAADRYLRVSGLAGLADADDPALDAGLREEGGRWRLAMDPEAFGVGAPDMPALLAGSRAPVVLARGERDAMVTDAQLSALGAPVASLAGLGHNAHVEDPEAVLALVERPR
jgi:pimeloyl-ACP methyl ester carboxylesterase